jgi:CheY-like chemotaxis protein
MPPKLLLADDSITVQRVIALTFAGEGLEVVTVGDGDQAVERIARDLPEIVLADVSMPGRDGYAVAEYVKRSTDHAARTRVVLLTGAFEPVDEARTRRLGVDGVLAKPFEPQMAIGLVRRLLEQPPAQASVGGAEAGTAEEGAPVAAASSEWTGGFGETSALGASRGHAAGYPFEPGSDEGQPPTQLDDYFRRLDEALATAGLAPAPVAAAESHAAPRIVARAEAGPVEAGAVEAGAAGSGNEVVAHEPAAAAEEKPMIEPTIGAEPHADSPTLILPPRQSAASTASTSAPTLVDAFAALLAVEQGEPGATVPAWPDTPAAPAGDTDALVEAVTQRVLARMTDATVREVVTARVLEVAERVVREEIERIKATAGE